MRKVVIWSQKVLDRLNEGGLTNYIELISYSK